MQVAFAVDSQRVDLPGCCGRHNRSQRVASQHIVHTRQDGRQQARPRTALQAISTNITNLLRYCHWPRACFALQSTLRLQCCHWTLVSPTLTSISCPSSQAAACVKHEGKPWRVQQGSGAGKSRQTTGGNAEAGHAPPAPIPRTQR